MSAIITSMTPKPSTAASTNRSIRFVERSNLAEGRMMLYRAHRDVHSQLPPESLSVSLNIMDEGEHILGATNISSISKPARSRGARP